MSKTLNLHPIIYTLGHSTRTLDDFLQVIRAYGIRRVVDVRTIPRSRHNPQFNREELSRFLRNRRIGYRHLKALGGLRHSHPDSPNTAWRNPSFRGFADYMQTSSFADALEKLMNLARERTTAIMCAEAVPWRCHRSLIGDALTVRNFRVMDIYTSTVAKEHILSPMARIRGTTVVYPG